MKPKLEPYPWLGNGYGISSMIWRLSENQVLSRIGALQAALDRHYGNVRNYSRSQLDHAAREVGFPTEHMPVVYASYMDRESYEALQQSRFDTREHGSLDLSDMLPA